jgi:hypothetical protein
MCADWKETAGHKSRGREGQQRLRRSADEEGDSLPGHSLESKPGGLCSCSSLPIKSISSGGSVERAVRTPLIRWVLANAKIPLTVRTIQGGNENSNSVRDGNPVKYRPPSRLGP